MKIQTPKSISKLTIKEENLRPSIVTKEMSTKEMNSKTTNQIKKTSIEMEQVMKTSSQDHYPTAIPSQSEPLKRIKKEQLME